MDVKQLMEKFSKRSVFIKNPRGEECLIHLIKETKSQNEISKILDVSPSAITQYKDQINNWIEGLQPFQKSLVAEQKEALKAISEKSKILSIEELGEYIQDNIDECADIIYNLSILPKSVRDEISFQFLRIKAMDKMEKSIAIYFDRYGSLSEVKASAELKQIKEKVSKTVNFLLTKFPDQPDIVRDYVKFLDQREEKNNG